jgi:hypothetical protein
LIARTSIAEAQIAADWGLWWLRKLFGRNRRVRAVLSKAEASHDRVLCGYRHTMLDSDISATRHARAFVCSALAGVIGHAEICVSGGAEHQGADGMSPYGTKRT